MTTERASSTSEAAIGAEFQLPPLTCDLPRVSDAVPNEVIRADDLARAMVDVAIRGDGERGGLVFENRDMRAMAGSFIPRVILRTVGSFKRIPLAI
jgi:hypothetical protein